MSTDIQLAQRPCAELIAGGFIALPLGLAVYLLTHDGPTRAYPVMGVLIAVVGWVLLGTGVARAGAKVDDLYRTHVTRSRASNR